MKNKALFILFCVTLFSALLSCKESGGSSDGCEITIEPPPEYLECWNFPVGSWWLYRLKGSDPEVYDTVRVRAVDRSLVQECGTESRKPNAPDACMVNYFVYLQHSNRRYFPNNQEMYRHEGSAVIWSNDFAMVPDRILSYPLVLGQEICTNTMLVDSYEVTVPAGTFRRMLHVTYERYAGNSDNYVTDFYTSRGLGLVMVSYSQLGTWELVEYQITP